jgi:DNA-binding response OmpR family regulator
VTRLLIAEDEVRISAFVDRGLRAAGFACTVANDGQEALAQARTGQFGLVLLDVGLPSLDGYEVLRQIRLTDASTPVIMLTARHASEDIVRGLDGGANDYIGKPFKFDELLARVRLRLRECTPAGLTEPRRGDLRLNLATRRAYLGDLLVNLTSREFALTREFLEHPAQVLSSGQLHDRVWGDESDSSASVVASAVAVLRSKIGADSIETVRGVGYRLK